MLVAESWHVRPLDYLRWSRKERLLAEMYLVAKGLKQEAAHKAQEQDHLEQHFDARAQQWAQELQRQYESSSRR